MSPEDLERRLGALRESATFTVFDFTRRGLFDRFIETETLVERYGLLNTQLRLPLVLTWGNVDLEIGYTYNIPRSLADGVSGLGDTSFFNVSLGYLFNLGKK